MEHYDIYKDLAVLGTRLAEGVRMEEEGTGV